ncbi:hypothetical protein ART_3720 [Arthrobacter sp. PAMC 25486]|uniref:TetR/AcrR family transcriptional regulator n=1 Tax=Arthrobacter sp. PAMC 25486 TaxID=1494608 RepID=UPI000536166C|nr:TetR/AcrR family transcriptional regulator [Arthrobacter sp. PAMC 25486]AIY03319.1 hypothetical protein ART_3720 [Arthrobacter sp. PAMC 25486]
MSVTASPATPALPPTPAAETSGMPAPPAPAGETLRERKRAATRLAIRRAAIELGLEHGYENVTVDLICAASDVSARTFFNYFGSKEGVYISPRKPLPGREVLEAFVAGGGSSVFAGLFDLIAGTFVEAESNLELFQARHQLIHRTPELLDKEKARISETEDLFVGYVMDRFRRDGRSIQATPDLEDEARMIVALVSGALRFALQKWVAGNFTDSREVLVRTASELIKRITANEHWP